jgi:hypothetical protein
VVTVTGGSNKCVSLAALIAIKPGQHPRLGQADAIEPGWNGTAPPPRSDETPERFPAGLLTSAVKDL